MFGLRSIRFRLSVQYSAVVFGLGGALLALVYLAIRQNLRSQTMATYVITGEPVYVNGELIGYVPALQEQEIRTLESLFNEHVLEELARFTIFSLVLLFFLSLVVGWFMAGRFLRPIGEITQVASDIQASDLSRRIGLQGPDDEMTRLAATFDNMLQRLDQAFRGQREFLANTSHDLRTPLAVIQSNVEVVAADEEATIEEWQEVGGIINRNVSKMSAMIDDLLAAARLESGKAQAVAVDLASIVQAKASEYESVAAARGVELEVSAFPALTEGVEVSLDRVLSNLLDNALEVSPASATIRIGSGEVDGWAWMAVLDEGPGLPEEPEEGRIGLGLTIVRQIVEAHAGSLQSDPGEDRGTVMTVWLPTGREDGDHPDRSPLTNS